MANWAKAGMILGQGIKETGTMIGGLMIKAEEKRKDRLYAEKLLTEERGIATASAKSKSQQRFLEKDYDKKFDLYKDSIKAIRGIEHPKPTANFSGMDVPTIKTEVDEKKLKKLYEDQERYKEQAIKAGAKWYMQVWGVDEATARKAMSLQISQHIEDQLGTTDATALGGGGAEGQLGTVEQASETILKGMPPGDFNDLFRGLDVNLGGGIGTESYGIPVQEYGTGETEDFQYHKPSFVDREKFGKVTLADLGEGEGSLRSMFEANLDVYKAGLLKAFQDRNILDPKLKARLPKDVAIKELEKMYPELYSEEGKEKIFNLMLKDAEVASGVAQQAEQFSTGEGELDAALEDYNPQYEQGMLMGVNRQTPVGAMQAEEYNPEYAFRQRNPSGDIYATQGGTVSAGEVNPDFPTMAPPLVEEGAYTFPLPQGVDELSGEKPVFSGSADMEPEEEAWAAFEAGVIDADQPLNILASDPQNPSRGDYITKTVREMYPDRVAEVEQSQGDANAPPVPDPSNRFAGMIGSSNPDPAFKRGSWEGPGAASEWELPSGEGRMAAQQSREPSPDAKIAAAVPDAAYPSMDTPYPTDDGRDAVTSVPGVPVEKEEAFENPFGYSDIVPIMKNGVLFYDVHTDRRDKPLGQMHAHMENNPIGVDKGINWHGLSADRATQGRQAKFDDPMYAYRAAARIIGRDYRDRGITTTEGIIREWLKSENEYRQFQNFDKVVNNYLKVIEDVTTLEADAEVATIDDIRKLLYGMTVEEMNGHFPYSMSVIREGIDNSGNWSFDKFKNRLALRPDAGNLRPTPDALYLLNEDEISGGESIEVLPIDPSETKKELNVYQAATENDHNNPHVYANVILNGGATIADLDGLPQALREEVLRILEEYNKTKTGQ